MRPLADGGTHSGRWRNDRCCFAFKNPACRPAARQRCLELLIEAVPKISRVLVPTYLSDPIAPLQVKAMETAASLLGVKLLVHDIRTADDLQPAFDAGAKELADATAGIHRGAWCGGVAGHGAGAAGDAFAADGLSRRSRGAN